MAASSKKIPRRYWAILWVAFLVIALGLYAAANWHPVTPGDANWYASAQLLDPIFAIDGTDPDKLQSAVTALLSTRNAMAKSYLDEDSATLRKTLYPEHFLTLLPQLQRARDLLLQEPSPAHATHYHTLLVRSIGAYTSDMRALSDAMIASPRSRTYLGFLAGTTTSALMGERLAEVAVSADAQLAKENKRFACYQHLDASCDSIAALREKLYAASKLETALPAPLPTTLAIDPVARDLNKYQHPEAANFSALIGIKSDCFPFSVSFLRTYDFPLENGSVARKAYLASDAYFYNLATTGPMTEGRTVELAARDKGARWEYQNITNDYMCPDAGLYVSDLQRGLSALTLAAQIDSAPARTFRGRQHIDLALAGNFVSQADNDAAAAQFIEGSADFNAWLQALVSDNEYVFASERQGKTIDLFYMLAARSNASLLFLLGNPTFVPGRPSLIASAIPVPINVQIYSWRYGLSQQMSTSSIELEAKKTIDILRSL